MWKWQPTPVSLPGKSHGQWSLVGQGPWGPKKVGHDFAIKQQEEHYQTHSKEKYTHVHTHSEFWFGASSNIFFMLAQCSKLLPQICLIVSVTKKQSIPPSQ